MLLEEVDEAGVPAEVTEVSDREEDGAEAAWELPPKMEGPDAGPGAGPAGVDGCSCAMVCLKDSSAVLVRHCRQVSGDSQAIGDRR